MIRQSPPVRRGADPIDDDHFPASLPHVEVDRSVVRFLGEPMDPELVGPAHLPLWRACDGRRALRSWPADERARLRRWHAAGLLVAAPAPSPAAAPAVTVVAPHPDDAQLAVGALLAGTAGRVVDVFSDETWTVRPYYRARPELAAELLIAEERVACRVLGAELTMLGHLDGAARPAWRSGSFATDPAGAGPVSVEPDLFAALVADVGAALAAPDAPAIDTGPVLAPLGVGGHVDHILVREVVLALVANQTVHPARLLWYEDMPYSEFSDAARLAAELAPRIGLGTLRPVLARAAAAHVSAKREALWTYRLQVPHGIAARVLRHGTRLAPGTRFAERLWAPTESVPMDVGVVLG